MHTCTYTRTRTYTYTHTHTCTHMHTHACIPMHMHYDRILAEADAGVACAEEEVVNVALLTAATSTRAIKLEVAHGVAHGDRHVHM